MKRMVSLVLGAVLAMGVTVAAQAQVSLGVGGGVTIPLGDFGDAAKTGWHGLGSLGYNLPSGLGVRGDFYYGQHSAKGAPSGVSAKWKLAGGLGNVLYSFGSPGGIRPYVLGSVGFMNLKVTASSGGASASASSTKLTFGGGAGLKFGASNTSFFVESRYLTVNTDGSNANFIPVTAGVNFGI
jgi:Outer membrane protein beta-barrel domain